MSIEGNALEKIQHQQALESDLQASMDVHSDHLVNFDPAEIEPDDKVDIARSFNQNFNNVEAVRAPGDEILLSLQRISDNQGANLQTLNDTITQMAAKNDITMADTLKLQKLLTDYQMTQDLISKGSDKVSQGLQTLFRNQ